MLNVMPMLLFEICPNFGKKLLCDKMYLNVQIQICGPHETGANGECLNQTECSNNIPVSAITRMDREGLDHLGVLTWRNVTFLTEGM